MANIASAKKRIRSSNRRSMTNKNRISAIRTHIKKVEEAIVGDKKEDARKALQVSESQMMVGAGKGKVSKKRMSRTISRLNKRIKNIKS
jgi:small subunit ribosomal protein S20